MKLEAIRLGWRIYRGDDGNAYARMEQVIAMYGDQTASALASACLPNKPDDEANS